MVGHSYYGDNRSVLSDLFKLIRDGMPAGGRFGLKGLWQGRDKYWRFVP